MLAKVSLSLPSIVQRRFQGVIETLTYRKTKSDATKLLLFFHSTKSLGKKIKFSIHLAFFLLFSQNFSALFFSKILNNNSHVVG
jgi:hypothetical protein